MRYLRRLPLQSTAAPQRADENGQLVAAGTSTATDREERPCSAGSTEEPTHLSETQASGMRPEPERVTALPPIQGVLHRVRLLADTVPVPQKQKPLSFGFRDEVRRHLEDLKQPRITERVGRSPWISAVVVS